MAWNPLTTKGAVVLDANRTISITAKEAARETKAKAAIAHDVSSGYLMHLLT